MFRVASMGSLMYPAFGKKSTYRMSPLRSPKAGSSSALAGWKWPGLMMGRFARILSGVHTS